MSDRQEGDLSSWAAAVIAVCVAAPFLLLGVAGIMAAMTPRPIVKVEPRPPSTENKPIKFSFGFHLDGKEKSR